MATIDARDIAEAVSEEPFYFIGMDGERYELPNVNTIPNRDGERINQGDTGTLRKYVPQDAFEALMDMPLGVSKKVMRAWGEHGDDGGKEGSPSARTGRSGARSRATSGRGGSTRKRSR